MRPVGYGTRRGASLLLTNPSPCRLKVLVLEMNGVLLLRQAGGSGYKPGERGDPEPAGDREAGEVAGEPPPLTSMHSSFCPAFPHP